jgi:hypothetical protein
MKTYSEKLRDPKWQKKRLEILERDKFSCQLCLDEKTELHVHHFTYDFKKEPWDYDDSNFITYCKHCHLLVESLLKEKTEILSTCKIKNHISTLCIKDNVKYVYFFKINEIEISPIFKIPYSELQDLETMIWNMRLNNCLILNKI